MPTDAGDDRADPAAVMAEVLRQAADVAADYRSVVARRPVQARLSVDEVARLLGGDLPVGSSPPSEVVARLAAGADGGLTTSTGPRYFGFVVGGSTPAATAADVLASGWDQNAFNAVLSPAAGAAEVVAGRWLKQLLGIPATASVGFVTGAQGANTAGLAAGRHQVLADAGWDVEAHGLQGAPRVRVVASEERHATVDRALRLLGLGNASVVPVAADGNGAIDVRDLTTTLDRLAHDNEGCSAPIVVLQAGNVNTGACDDLRTAVTLAHEHAAWVHVDGAFGLWAGASPQLRHLVDGVELADSWACDGHKWLNLPYDSGFAFCRDATIATTAMSHTAPYLTGSGVVTGMGDLTPESSRRARGFAAWAGISELGSDGIAHIVEHGCRMARRFAEGLTAGGVPVVNDVVLNQVLADVAGGDAALTERIVDAVQREGTCWVGATTWHGRRLLRISVSNATTTEDDVDLSVDAILRACRHESGTATG